MNKKNDVPKWYLEKGWIVGDGTQILKEVVDSVKQGKDDKEIMQEMDNAKFRTLVNSLDPELVNEYLKRGLIHHIKETRAAL